MDRSWHLTIAVVVAGMASCGPALGDTSNILEPTTQTERLPNPQTGKICWFGDVPNDGPESFVRLVASGRDAVVRFEGRPVLLRFDGERLRAGGTFRAPGMTVSIEDVPLSQARSEEPFDAIVRVSVDAAGKSEAFRALWFCQGRDADP
jgi:hypothetical protein